MDYDRPVEEWQLFPYRPLSVAAFLRRLGSPVARHLPEFAHWVEEAAAGNEINPRWLLVLAEKEQTFLTRPWGKDQSWGTWQRALDYTLGYGATDSGDLPQYRGTRTQVYAAARALRRYLTPGDPLYVGKLLSRPFKCGDGTVVPANLASAALYQYTPWRYAAADFVAIWNRFAKAAPDLWNLPSQEVSPMNPADVAEEVVRARKAGYARATVNGVEFNTEEAGWCSRFVRLCHLAARLLPPGDEFGPFSCCAHSTAQHLQGAGRRVQSPSRGDVVAFTSPESGQRCRTCGQAVWHAGIYLGEGRVAENTSSGSRGDPRAPGTKVSALAEVGLSRVWGYFRLWKAAPAEAYRDGPVRIKVLDVPYTGFLRAGRTYFGSPEDESPLPVRALEQGGFQIFDHIPDERTVYVYLRPGTSQKAL